MPLAADGEQNKKIDSSSQTLIPGPSPNRRREKILVALSHWERVGVRAYRRDFT
jgi:hypothetical protein